MDAPLCLCAIYAILALRISAGVAHETDPQTTVRNEVNSRTNSDEELKVHRLEIIDGVSVNIPRSANDTKLLTFELDFNKDVQEGRGKDKKGGLMQRILPLFIMPFVLQSAIVPMFLSMLKFMLMKSLMVGKIALALIVFNAFKNHNSFKGRDTEIANVHYGYHGNGMEEYGAYVN